MILSAHASSMLDCSDIRIILRNQHVVDLDMHIWDTNPHVTRSGYPFARTCPRTLNCSWLPDGLPYGLHATLWCPFLTPTTPTLPLLAPKKPFIRPETHPNLPARPH